MGSEGKLEESTAPLLDYSYSNVSSEYEEEEEDDHEKQDLKRRVWIESKKLWYIVGPAIFSRITSYSMNVITQAFAGHLGDLDLAAISIVNNVIVGFDFGLLLGMASALETLCGQAYGAKKYHMLGVYMQRSWIVLFACCLLLLPIYIFATPVLKLLGQPSDVAELSEVLAESAEDGGDCLGVPGGTGGSCGGELGVGVWVEAWGAFSGLWDFFKLSASSGLMLCLENWYYRILILMTGNLKNATIAVDALSICMTINGWEMMIPLAFFAGTGMTINGWEMMIPLAFFAGTGVRVANELGAGNGKGAKFAAIVSVITSIVIGLFFWLLIMIFHNEIAIIFSSSKPVLEAVNKLSILLAFTILLNSVQPVLSGVAVGSGWQSQVAYINVACYYMVGVPLGFMMEWVFHQGVKGIWAGMIFGGTALQTLILAITTLRCNWEKEAEKASKHVKEWADSS
ncbi:unnamed protein product [Ilex paraguariensis]|uniref:Protein DETOXIFICATION n=1 Tax=Ilex paraguariensis TaxID=185542 RepID=A0ABC8TJV9_9AQUA